MQTYFISIPLRGDSDRPKGTSPVLVTHQVDITSLSGVFPQSGEIVVLRPDGENLTLVGRIPHR